MDIGDFAGIGGCSTTPMLSWLASSVSNADHPLISTAAPLAEDAGGFECTSSGAPDYMKVVLDNTKRGMQ